MSIRRRLRGWLATFAFLPVPSLASATPDAAPSWMQACAAKVQRARPSWPARYAAYEERTAFLPAVPELPGGIRYELYEGDRAWLTFEILPYFDGQLRTRRKPHQRWVEFRARTGWESGRLKSARHYAHINLTMDPSVPSKGGGAEPWMERSLKNVAKSCLDLADRFPSFLPLPDLESQVIHPSCDRNCTCTFAGPPLFTETGPGPAAVEFLGPLLSRTYRTDDGGFTTTLSRWIDLLEGRSKPVATTPGPHAPWLQKQGEPGPERPWPHRVRGFGHPAFYPSYEALPDRIVITETWGPRKASTLLMPRDRQLVVWRRDAERGLLLLAVGDWNRVSWYLVWRPRISMDLDMDETLVLSCW